jgi:hyperosmotically inducible periplasmic protein
MKKYNPAVLLLALAVSLPLASLVVIGCGGGGRAITKAVKTNPDDATITTRVKTALLNDPEIKSKIDVETFNGVVTLSGAVKTAVERDKAVAIARKANGVSDVKSTLQVP